MPDPVTDPFPVPVPTQSHIESPRNRHGRQKTIELMTWLWTVGIVRFGSGSRLALGLVGALLFIPLLHSRLPQVAGAALLSYGGETYALKVLLNYAKLLNFNNETDRTATRWNYKFSLELRLELEWYAKRMKMKPNVRFQFGFLPFVCISSTLAAIAPHSDAIPARRRRAARRLMGPSNWSLMLPFISLVSTRLGSVCLFFLFLLLLQTSSISLLFIYAFLNNPKKEDKTRIVNFYSNWIDLLPNYLCALAYFFFLVSVCSNYFGNILLFVYFWAANKPLWAFCKFSICAAR